MYRQLPPEKFRANCKMCKNYTGYRPQTAGRCLTAGAPLTYAHRMRQNSSAPVSTGSYHEDLLLLFLLLPLYFQIWGRFGQKFAVAALLSMTTGVCCWFLSLIFKPAASDNPSPDTGSKSQIAAVGQLAEASSVAVDANSEKSAPLELLKNSANPAQYDNQAEPASLGSLESTQLQAGRFGWSLFLLFPLLCPLALPLWLIPGILVATYTIVFNGFGGFGRHIFNPVAVAVVFMLVGYGHTASLHAVRPLPGPYDGFTVWNAGAPVAKPVWHIYADVPVDELFQASFSGLLPAIPGSAFGLPLLLASAVLALAAGHRRIWWVTSVLALQLGVMLLNGSAGLNISPLHPLFLGIIPTLLLVAVIDRHSLPDDIPGQIVDGLLFAFFALLFVFRSPDLLGPAYGLLLAQIAAPLATDLIMRRFSP